MARFLPEPRTDKATHAATLGKLRIGAAAMQGWRDAMEDVDVVRALSPSLACVGVFDGHGGRAVAEAAAAELVERVAAGVLALDDGDGVGAADPTGGDHAGDKGGGGTAALTALLVDAFLETDAALERLPELQNAADETGATGLLALVSPTHVVVANVGDSRCILSARGAADAFELSRDHKPACAFERERILAAGGSVFSNRVCGGVAVSRSFGDFWFKRNDKLPPYAQLVTAEPAVHVYKRQPDDEFLLLACDGVYDVLTNDQLRRFIRRELHQGERDPTKICEKLLDECLRKLSRDNMSAVLVLF